MATATTSKWGGSFTPVVKLTVTESKSNPSNSVLSYKLEYITTSGYTASASSSREYTITINGQKITGTANINGKTTFTIKEGTVTVNKTKSSQTIDFSVSFGFNITWDGTYGGTKSASGSISIGAKTSYTVKYNMNNGSGDISDQKKWYGEALTLSSIKPTRTGYTFQGWGTSSSTSTVAYKSGASYTANANVTLYAVWKKNVLTIKYDVNEGSGTFSNQTKEYGSSIKLYSNTPTRTGFTFKGWNTAESGSGTNYNAGATYSDDSKIKNGNATTTLYAQWDRNSYTIKYDANGGDGAPASQKKYYNQTLVLSPTKPTKDKHTFLGWSDSATGAVLYQAGGSYPASNNASATLYAVWKLNYINPTISNLKAVRCDSDGSASADSTYARVTATWSVDKTIDQNNIATNVKIQYVNTEESSWTDAYSVDPNASYGTIDTVIGGGMLSASHSWYVRVTVTDSGGSKSVQAIIPHGYRILDIGNEGKSIAIGRVADESVDGFHVGIQSRFYDGLYANELHVDFDGDGADYKKVNLSTPLANNTDLNDVKDVGVYYRPTTSTTVTNAPSDVGNSTYSLEVISIGNSGQVLQRVTRGHKTLQYVSQRAYYSGAWGDWQTTMYKGQKVLWSGKLYMSDTQTVTLSEKVSEQDNGICLIFGRYKPDTSETQDSDLTTYFVPKKQVELFPGKGVSIPCYTAGLGNFGLKYIYVSDSSLKGYANNVNSGTSATGITYTNSYWVLRYVIGC